MRIKHGVQTSTEKARSVEKWELRQCSNQCQIGTSESQAVLFQELADITVKFLSTRGSKRQLPESNNNLTTIDNRSTEQLQYQVTTKQIVLTMTLDRSWLALPYFNSCRGH